MESALFGGGQGQAISIVVGVAFCAIGIILLIALKQALVLSIDAVDILIADRADALEEKRARRDHALQEFAHTDK